MLLACSVMITQPLTPDVAASFFLARQRNSATLEPLFLAEGQLFVETGITGSKLVTGPGTAAMGKGH